MKITAHGPDDLIAALPHLLGFNPQESVVLVPFTPALPVARIDVPHTAAEREAATNQLARPFLRQAPQAGPDPTLAIVCLTEDGQAASQAAESITEALSPQIAVPVKLWADERTWTDLDTGSSGVRTNEAATRLAAESVVAGRQVPLGSREELQRNLIGDREPLAAALPAAAENWSTSSVDVERRWVEQRIGRFREDGISLSDPDAARLLVGAQDHPIRDAAWSMMTQDDSPSHRALWSDLTRRAPDEVRTPAATLLAFSAWLGGDGASAWTALDQIPEGHQDYGLAGLMAVVLENAVPPSQWTTAIRPALLDESATRASAVGPVADVDNDADIISERPRRPEPPPTAAAPTSPPPR